MKKKVLLSSIATIALCLCLIGGSTFALFTDKTEFNIAVTAGDVEVEATINEFNRYSVKPTVGGSIKDEWGGSYEYEGPLATFTNGGTAEFDASTALLTLENITPGDKVAFNVSVDNKSTDIAILYRYVIKCEDELMKGLNVYVDGVRYNSLKSYTSAWAKLDANQGIVTDFIEIELPVTAGNEFEAKSAAINVTVEAVQFNADVVIGGDIDVELFDGQLIFNADDLVEALESGKGVLMNNDVNIDPASMSNAYGTTGINVKNGQTIDGGGYVLDIAGAGGTWDSGISTTGGIIRDITVTGAFRGIFVNHNSTHSEKVILENVTIDGTTYTISCDQGTSNGLEAINSTFNGWTSYAGTLGEARFVSCSFGEGNGYAFCRPYAPTEFVNCDFEAGYTIDPRAAVTFENCTYNGAPITADNVADLVTSTANVTVK